MQQLVPLYLPCYRVSQANRRLYGISCDEAQSCRDRKQRWEQKAQEVDGERGWCGLKGSRSMLRWVGEGKVGQHRKCRGESIAWNSSLPCSSLSHCLCIQGLVAEVRYLLVQPRVAESTAETTLFYPRGHVALAVNRGKVGPFQKTNKNPPQSETL